MEITSISPTSGPAGTSVTLTGSGFTGASAVLWGSASLAFTVDSDTKIVAGPISGGGPGSSHPFIVENDGQATDPDGPTFTLTAG